MYSEIINNQMRSMQTALQIMAALNFTSHQYPPQACVTDGDTFDFIIVGGGTAGCVVANRLSETNATVLLIEAGGDPPIESQYPATVMHMKDTKYDWQYTSGYEESINKCHRNPYFEMTQGKMLGGSSSLNFLVYGRGYAEDYNAWARKVKDNSWNWENVLPYFIKSERLEDTTILNSRAKNYHGVNGYLGVTRDMYDARDFFNSMKYLGHDFVTDINDDTPLGYTNSLYTIAKGQRQSSAFAYLTPVKHRKNLHVLKNTMARKIITQNKIAAGVIVQTKHGVIRLKAAKEVIVSAGAFNTPKLLMLSGIGPKQHLEHKGIEVIQDLPVGKNLHDHVGVNMVYQFNRSTKFDPVPTEHPVPVVVGFISVNQSQSFPDYQTQNYFTQNPELLVLYCAFEARYRPDICDYFYQPKHHIIAQVIQLNPKSRGRVLLGNDPLDNPYIDIGYLKDKRDLDELVSFVKDYHKIVNTDYFKRNGGELLTYYTGCNSKFGSRDFWECYVRCMINGIRHYAGTCAMGSVVDSKLRVIGVSRLRVVDASVMPQVVRGNPAAPVMMLGEKAAVFIKIDHHL